MTVAPSRLRQLIDYDEDTGLLVAKVETHGRWKAGRAMGTRMTNGYISVTVDSCRFLAHRVAWAIKHGSWPTDQIDHINGDRSDNRLSNLRSATNQQNSSNKTKHARNKSGHIGVHWREDAKKWRASIMIRGKRKYLGYFDTKDEAAKAYREWSQSGNSNFSPYGQKT